jgi:hypothetical protein
MLSCAQFLDRILDEDSRRALEGSLPAPADVAEHGETCASCRRAWLEAALDLRQLPGLLLEPAPRSLERRIRARMGERRPRATAFDWGQGVAWAGVGTALTLYAAQVFPAMHILGPLAWGLTGAAVAFAASAAREALQEAGV